MLFFVVSCKAKRQRKNPLTIENTAFSRVCGLELLPRFELGTSSLPSIRNACIFNVFLV